MDYLKLKALRHSTFTEEEKARRKNALKVINTDFYQDLPYQITSILDEIRWSYKNCSWFEEAWNEYRKHVLEAGLGGKIKMPGSVFNKYIDEYVDKQGKEIFASEGQCCCTHYEEFEVDFLSHHGIKGQKWGIRRYQNDDGTLTEEGKKRYEVGKSGSMTDAGKKLYKQDRKESMSEALKERKTLIKQQGHGKELATYLIGEKYGKITVGDIKRSDAASGIAKKVAKGAGFVAAAAASFVLLPYALASSVEKFYTN